MRSSQGHAKRANVGWLRRWVGWSGRCVDVKSLALLVPSPVESSDRGLARPPTRDTLAYQLYLQGRAAVAVSDFRRAGEFFQLAIQRDSAFALAYSGLARVYINLDVGGQMPTAEADAKARATAAQALALAPDLDEARAVRAVALVYDYNWTEAEREFRRALELSPGNTVAMQWYAILLSSTNRPAEAIAMGRRASALDPQAAGPMTWLGNALRLDGRFEEALEVLRKLTTIYPISGLGWYYHWLAAWEGGRR